MATLKNLTISDTGFLNLPQGTTGQRPTVPTITINGFYKPLSIAHDGLQLWAGAASQYAWQPYAALPDYLRGLQCTTTINDGATTFNCSHATRVYMLRDTAWTVVDLTGYNLIESGKGYIPSYTSISVYYKDFVAGGPYNINSYSAMYFFNPIAGGTTLLAGALRFNTTNNCPEVWTGSEWINMSNDVTTATGGTISGAVSAGGYVIHTFTSDGTFTPTYSGTVDVLLVAGGGAGAGLGGGGGAGGLIYQSNFNVVGGLAYPVSIGIGGSSSGNTHGPNGNSGGNTIFGGGGGGAGIIAIGGGGGNGYSQGDNARLPGGSGGGGPGHGQVDGQRPAGDGTKGQGHPGGYGHHGGTGPAQALTPQPAGAVYGGGGGGGAGEAGIPRWSRTADAKGGDGIASSIAGTSNQYFAGGGGGGLHGPGGSYGRPNNSGGRGGGGGTGSTGIPQAAHNGTTNSGSGGAGIVHDNGLANGTGAPGIVIVRYKK